MATETTEGVTPAEAGSLRAWAKATFDLARGRQALLSVAQPALGALLAAGGLPSARVMSLGLVAATAGYVAVFSLNDVLDRRADAQALRAGTSGPDGFDIDTAYVRHPLARGDLTLRASAAWVGTLAVVSALAAYLLSPLCLAFFALAVVLEVGYCALRSVTWTKTVVSGLMVGVGGLAGWVAVAPLSSAAWPFFTFLALWEIGGRNLPNDLTDVESDSRIGITTVATVFSPVVSARAVLALAPLTCWALALLPMPMPLPVLGVALGIWSLLLPAITLAERPVPEQAGAYFNRASLLPALVFVPVLIAALVR